MPYFDLLRLIREVGTDEGDGVFRVAMGDLLTGTTAKPEIIKQQLLKMKDNPIFEADVNEDGSVILKPGSLTQSGS